MKLQPLIGLFVVIIARGLRIPNQSALSRRGIWLWRIQAVRMAGEVEQGRNK